MSGAHRSQENKHVGSLELEVHMAVTSPRLATWVLVLTIEVTGFASSGFHSDFPRVTDPTLEP